VVVASVWASCGGAMAKEAKEHTQWKAEWVTMAGVPQRDEVVLHFRKVIEIGTMPPHFWVDVSADNQFVFYVNGKRVGTGPAKSDLAHWRYETFDLGPFLHAGKNVLAATVWNFGAHAAVSQMSDRVGFLVHGEGETERAVDTNESWDVEQERGIETLRTNLPGFYYVAGPGEKLDAGKFDWSFDREEVKDKSGWTKAVTLGRGALRWERDAPNNWQLVADPLPEMEMREVANGKVVRATGMVMPVGFPEKGCVVPAQTKASILVDRGELVTGYPALTVSEGAGSRIRMTYAEALFDEKGQKGNRNEIEGKHILGVADEFVVGGAEEKSGPPQKAAAIQAVFMPLGWRTWRYLQIDVETEDAELRIDGLRTWFSAFPFEERGYFRSDDASLKKIWEIGWRTERLGAHDTYTDAPYWERLQYVGDTRIETNISYAVAGDDRLARQAIEAINNSRIPEGLTQSRYPSELVQMIPTFSLMWVGMVHDFWMYRGDAEFVKAQLPGVRSVLNWYVARQRADGLLGKIPWWPFVDWGKDFVDGVPAQEEDGGSSVITLQYVEALRYAAEMEEVLGDKHTAEIYREAAERGARGVYQLCWVTQFGLLADTPAQKHFSQHANILGVWLDVIPRERQAVVMEKILSASDAGFAAKNAVPPMTAATYYFRFYLARALDHAGMGDHYLQLLGPWREMVGLGLTTWAEQPEPTRSDSHAWSAHPNFDLLTIVAGIRPAVAGFEKVRIEPHLGALQHVEAGMPTPKGMIEVKYTRVGDGVEAEVRLPEGVSGELVWEGKVVEVHGGEQKVRIGGK
jgi:alpha-L-rhamnosidase